MLVDREVRVHEVGTVERCTIGVSDFTLWRIDEALCIKPLVDSWMVRPSATNLVWTDVVRSIVREVHARVVGTRHDENREP